VTSVIRQPSGLFARTDGPYKAWSDVVAAAQGNPGGVTVAITGPNSPDEATVNYLAGKGIRMTNVPYARPGERYTAVLGKHVDLLYEQVPRLWSRWVFSGGLKDSVRTKLVPSRHGDASGVRGAAWLGRDPGAASLRR